MKYFRWFLFLALVFPHSPVNAQSPSSADSSGGGISRQYNLDSKPEFPGGRPAWNQFLEKNLNAATPVENGSPIGLYIVEVEFLVDSAGNLSKFRPLTKLGYGMEKEVVRILGKSGHWIPAMLNEQPVAAFQTQSVTFIVQSDFDVLSDTPHLLFTGWDNLLQIKSSRYRDIHSLKLTISEGTIELNSADRFIARVNKPGRVIISIYHGRKNELVGEASFEVKSPDNPKAGN